jgi:hypothetical protein
VEQEREGEAKTGTGSPRRPEVAVLDGYRFVSGALFAPGKFILLPPFGLKETVTSRSM